MAIRNLLASAIVLGAGCAFGWADFTWDLTHEFSGGQTPSGAPPLRATFEQTASNEVTLRLEALFTFGSTEFIQTGGWSFNIDDSFFDGLGNALFNVNSGTVVSGDVAVLPTDIGRNDFKADGDGWFDIRFNFQNSAGAGRFGVGDIVEFVFEGDGGPALTEAAFYHLSYGDGNSPDGLYTAGHVGGIGGGDEDSGWITVVPAPTSALLGVLGIAAVCVVKRR